MNGVKMSETVMIAKERRFYAWMLLAVFTAGALLLPFAHEFTHIRSLEHSHGQPAADLSAIAVGPGGFAAIDFLVEERTVPHNPNCDLCARLALDKPSQVDPVGPFPYVDAPSNVGEMVPCSRTASAISIRAPPVYS